MSFRIEDRDHDDRADVVDDRERQQEQLQRLRHACRAPRVRRPRMRCRSPSGSPTRDRPNRRAFDRHVEQRRDHHPADRGEDGQAAVRRSRKLTSHELTLDLEADDEEEDRHQPVVDPMEQVFGDRETGPTRSSGHRPTRRRTRRRRCSPRPSQRPSPPATRHRRAPRPTRSRFRPARSHDPRPGMRTCVRAMRAPPDGRNPIADQTSRRSSEQATARRSVRDRPSAVLARVCA